MDKCQTSFFVGNYVCFTLPGDDCIFEAYCSRVIKEVDSYYYLMIFEDEEEMFCTTMLNTVSIKKSSNVVYDSKDKKKKRPLKINKD